MPEIIPRQQLQPANAVILGINVVASLCGLIVIEQIVTQEEVGSVRDGMLLGAVLYLVSGTFFAFLRPIHAHRAVEGEASRAVWPAIVYSWKHKRLLSLIGLNLMLWTIGALVVSALPGLGRTHHGLSGDALLAYDVRTGLAVGVGMLTGAIAIGTLGRRKESAITLTCATLLVGVCLLLLATVSLCYAQHR